MGIERDEKIEGLDREESTFVKYTARNSAVDRLLRDVSVASYAVIFSVRQENFTLPMRESRDVRLI